MANQAQDRYVVISADGHAGADIQHYKPYLESKWHAEFDEWAKAFNDPWLEVEDSDRKFGVASGGGDSTFSWDSSKRNEALEAEGIVGEVIFPNTAPPFFPSAILTAAAPRTREEYERRWAGLRAHNRWLVDFCGQLPGRRAGVAQVFLNDVDDTVGELHWIKESGLTGGIILPGDSPDNLVPLYLPRYNRIWELCAEYDIPVHRHANVPGHSPTPEYGVAAPAIGLIEAPFFAKRGLAHMIFNGVFERYPNLKYVTTEDGAGWVPSHLAELDGLYEAAHVSGSIVHHFVGAAAEGMTKKPSEYFASNCYLGASFLTGPECAMRDQIGVDKIMWGSDLPHLEGTYPYSLEAMRAAFAGVPESEVRRMLAGTAAEVYNFDLDFLQSIANKVGPTVSLINEPLVDGPKFPSETVTPPLIIEPMPGSQLAPA
ncbi:amidohydrolase family protein [Nocardia sp. CA-135953]|uniref:amidohydrolase family protein n=1 Tax=Nocardia sp. CA-135953 TaxID=3239978 RepID=UPI003D959AE6